jgi:hypothetical protein
MWQILEMLSDLNWKEQLLILGAGILFTYLIFM